MAATTPSATGGSRPGPRGRSYTEALAKSLRQASGAGALRVARPGEAYTLKYRAERLNVRGDEAGVITAIGCG